jgi:periplasmic copper chaperone A
MLRVLAAAALTAAALLASVAAASAHVAVTPERSAPGQFLAYTVTVPNELEDQATTAVEVTLPDGFTLEAAQAVPGWTTRVTRKADGSAGRVRWSGGRIPPGTFAAFQLRGRNGDRAATMAWKAVQRYERTTVSWAGAADADTPAATTRVDPAASSGTGQPAAPAAAGADSLARSRAALAGVLAGTALLVSAVVALRGRQARTM